MFNRDADEVLEDLRWTIGNTLEVIEWLKERFLLFLPRTKKRNKFLLMQESLLKHIKKRKKKNSLGKTWNKGMGCIRV